MMTTSKRTLPGRIFSPALLAMFFGSAACLPVLQECDAQQYRTLQYSLALASPAYIGKVRAQVHSDRLSRWDYAMLLRAYWANAGRHTLAKPPEVDDVLRERVSFHAALHAVR